MRIEIGDGNHEDGVDAVLSIESEDGTATFEGRYRHKEMLTLQGVPNQGLRTMVLHIDEFSFPESESYSGTVEIRCGNGREAERDGDDYIFSLLSGTEVYLGSEEGNELAYLYPWVKK